MKRVLLGIISIMVLYCLPCGSQNRIVCTADLKTNYTGQDSKPRRIVVAGSTAIEVEYEIPAVGMREDPLFTGCHLLDISGFSEVDEPECPATSLKNDWFIVPDGCVAQVEVTEGHYKDFPMELGPARQPLGDGSYETDTVVNILPVKAYEGFSPQNPVILEEVQIYRGMKIQNVKVNPIQYNYKERKVRVYSSLSYKVSLRRTAVQTRIDNARYRPAITSLDDNMFNVAMNRDKISLPTYTQSNDTTAMIIITTPKFMSAVERYVELKKLFGYTPHIVSRENWTSKDVKDVVKQAYLSMPTLRYMVIVGDHQDVPAESLNFNNHVYISDYRYGCMDGDDDMFADIYRGRLPASTLDEANDFIDKLVKYSLDPVTDQAFYDNVGACAYFQDESSLKDGYADRRYAQTAEEIGLYLENFNKIINRIYYTYQDVNPLYWNNGTYSTGNSIPEYLKRPQFEWDGDYHDIVDHINAGSFLVYHRDHGSTAGWYHPTFYKDHLSLLKNANKYPIVFSVNCDTGNFQDACFAETMLNMKKSGCIGIYAATCSSYVGYEDMLACGFINSMWPAPGLIMNFPRASFEYQISVANPSLGAILDSGLMFMGYNYGSSSYNRYMREVYHCFGDPSMNTYKEIPMPSEPTVIRGNRKVSVSVNDRARITFINSKTDEVVSCIFDPIVQKECVYETLDTRYVSICVSIDGKIPHVDYGDDPNCIYIQNEVLVGSRNFNAERIRIGSEVSPNRASGKVEIKSGIYEFNASKEIYIEPETNVSGQVNMRISILED